MKLSVSFCLTIFFVFLSSLIIGTTPFLFDLLTTKAIKGKEFLEEHLGTIFFCSTPTARQDRSNQ
ncbi:hypothetical protein OAM44_02435 [Pelagibacteraceae bacterium]|nr:hypothetical protein [Pelagibacteraceae bacterium]